MVDGIVILYRVCDSVSAYNTPRIFGSKPDIIRKSVESLRDTISCCANDKIPITVNVIFDKTSQSTIKFTVDTLSAVCGNVRVHNTKKAQDGNMESFKLAYTIAKNYTNKLLFFCEDDYVIKPEFLSDMFYTYHKFEPCCHPCFKPHHETWSFERDNFGADGTIWPREIVLGKCAYWFRDKTSTCTFCIDSEVFKDCENLFEATFGLSRVMETHLNKMWEKYPLFASIPPYAEHMQCESSVSPFFDKRIPKITKPYKINFQSSSKSI